MCILFQTEHNYGEAQSHFLHSNNGQQCATMLVEYAVTCGYPSEADLFVAQAVLQYVFKMSFNLIQF